jgi:hypothetical protein
MPQGEALFMKTPVEFALVAAAGRAASVLSFSRFYRTGLHHSSFVR